MMILLIVVQLISEGCWHTYLRMMNVMMVRAMATSDIDTPT